jgi:hypothetical protein
MDLKPDEVFQILENLIGASSPQGNDAELAKLLLDTIGRYQNVLSYYAGRNYDQGVLARDAMMQPWTDDDRLMKHQSSSAGKLRPMESDSDN